MTGLRAPTASAPSDYVILGAINESRARSRLAERVIRREPNRGTGTFRAETVVCALADGAIEMFWCKYGERPDRDTYGHRDGLARERATYEFLTSQDVTQIPRFVGFGREGELEFILLEFVPDAIRVSRRPELMQEAARIAGDLHREFGIQPEFARWCPAYSADYYRVWAERTLSKLDAPSSRKYAVEHVIEKYLNVIQDVSEVPQSFIHGEYVPRNIIASGDALYVLDWESAALGLGEIDLVALIDKWDGDVREKCIATYVDARWGEEAPTDFELRFSVAEIYWQLRWLGGDEEPNNVPWRLQALQDAATLADIW